MADLLEKIEHGLTPRGQCRCYDKLPELLFHEDCEYIIRTLPALPLDPKNSEDVDTDADDHGCDQPVPCPVHGPAPTEETEALAGGDPRFEFTDEQARIYLTDANIHSAAYQLAQLMGATGADVPWPQVRQRAAWFLVRFAMADRAVSTRQEGGPPKYVCPCGKHGVCVNVDGPRACPWNQAPSDGAASPEAEE